MVCSFVHLSSGDYVFMSFVCVCTTVHVCVGVSFSRCEQSHSNVSVNEIISSVNIFMSRSKFSLSVFYFFFSSSLDRNRIHWMPFSLSFLFSHSKWEMLMIFCVTCNSNQWLSFRNSSIENEKSNNSKSNNLNGLGKWSKENGNTKSWLYEMETHFNKLNERKRYCDQQINDSGQRIELCQSVQSADLIGFQNKSQYHLDKWVYLIMNYLNELAMTDCRPINHSQLTDRRIEHEHE